MRSDAGALASPATRPHGHVLARTLVAPWRELFVAAGWSLVDDAGEADLVVCFDGPAAAETARSDSAVGVIHVPLAGATWAGAGADLVLYDPTRVEFFEACERSVRLSRARRMAREYASDVLECSPDAFFVLDWDRRVAYQNPRALALVARVAGGNGDVLGEPLAEHLPAELSAGLEPAVREALRDVAPRAFETFVPTLGGWIECTAYFIPGGVALYMRDITARQRGAERTS